MAKPLLVVESPAKARTIAGFLGDDYVVKSSVGHIRDLPSNAREIPKAYKGTPAGRLGIDVENHFEPIYVVHADKKQVVTELKQALKGASELYLATDEDREGEAIAWHVLEVLKPSVPVKRMVFHEITRHAILDAIDQPRELDMKLVEAQEGRRVLDRLVGYEISPVLWKKVMPRLSAGRVQSVATRLVVERERERMAFRAGDWWDLKGDFTARGQGFEATLTSIDGRGVPAGKDFDPATGHPRDPGAALALLDEDGARGLAARLESAEWSVGSVEAKPWRRQPHPPFITSTLQQEAGRKLGFGSARTMRVAQGLYERGYITYMRTDSTNLSDQAIGAARSRIRELYGEEYLPREPRTYARKVKNAQEAHEAIRPAGDEIHTPEEVSGAIDRDELRLYELIWMRTMASQMTDARGQSVTVRLTATSSDGEDVELRASGRTIEFPGFMRAYVEGADDPEAELENQERPMPTVDEGERVDCRTLEAVSHTTQPPARYTEASLVKVLEERGIGRPSTYASVIQTIQDRGYVWKKGSALVPSWIAFAVIQLLEGYFGELVDYGFTAAMEEDLDQIANHRGEAEKWLHAFYNGDGQPGLRELVSENRLEEIDRAKVNAIPIGTDPEGNELVVRAWPEGGKLERGDDKVAVPVDLAPDELTVAKALELLEKGAGGPRVLGDDPETGKVVLALTGRYGPFVQLGEIPDGSKEKPPRASLLSRMDVDTVTLDEALALLALPRVVGVDDGEEITAQNGRYGPYLKKGGDSRSLETEEQIFTVTLEEAKALFAQPKRRRGQRTKPPIAELGEHPDSGAPVRVLDGRYGPYVTDGTLNATVPRGLDPASVTLERAVDLLAERAARGPAKKKAKKTAKKKAARKKATKKKATRKQAAKPVTKATARSATKVAMRAEQADA